MEKSITPTHFLLLIQKKKYKFLLIPILLVLISFVANFYISHDFLKLLSLIGFILYLFISFLFRVKRLHSISDNNDQAILSPIYGIIKTISPQKIVIEKRWFDPIELRHATNCEKVTIKFNKEITTFQKNNAIVGQLYGLVMGKVICSIEIPENMTVLMQPRESVQAGISLLCDHKQVNEP